MAYSVAGNVYVIPKSRVKAITGISSAQTMNAPTADANSTRAVPAPALTRSAAPGVDHANDIGMRSQKPSTIQVSPTARHRAKSPDAAWTSVAPTARKPAMTSANDVAKPVMAATMPAEMG